ncbi:MAG: tol-pal system-associated acyl-CoA thioesterase [Betaproteobacteria bacterium]|nr:tol-pal system-associated acyl-CoA thioesterase [Betaproteobacteria bacterium]
MNEFVWPVRVYWEDTDAGGVVYYANYLKFLERARSEWLRTLGIHQRELATQEDVLFVVRRVEVDYLKPARFEDALAVQSRITEMGRASLTMAQQIRRGDEVLLSAQVKLACVSASAMRPAKIPPYLLVKLNDA